MGKVWEKRLSLMEQMLDSVRKNLVFTLESVQMAASRAHAFICEYVFFPSEAANQPRLFTQHFFRPLIRMIKQNTISC